MHEECLLIIQCELHPMIVDLIVCFVFYLKNVYWLFAGIV